MCFIDDLMQSQILFTDIRLGNRSISESVDKSVLDNNFKKKSGGNFLFIKIQTNRKLVEKYLSTDKTYTETYKKHFDSIKGEIVVDRNTDKLLDMYL